MADTFSTSDLGEKIQSSRPELSPPATADRADKIAHCVHALLEARTAAGDAVTTPKWRRSLLDEASVQMARARGVEAHPWEAEPCANAPLRQALDKWPTSIWEDPHALGWIHEQVAASARHKSFADHVHLEKKHSSQTVSTQLYTPRWIADVMVRAALEETDEAAPTVLDPAVGGGQMLLAALAVIADAAPEAPAEVWVRALWGFDLDPAAVEAARRTIALEVARRKGGRQEKAEAICRRQITVADALDDAGDRRWSLVITNPPYMGWRSMPPSLRERLDPRFRPYHRDLFSVFIARCHELADEVVAILAQQSIWYLRRFEKARRHLLQRGHLTHFIHLGAGAFWNLDGEKASVAAFVQRTEPKPSTITRVWDLRHAGGPEEKRLAFQQDPKGRAFDLQSIEAVPGRPLCHDLPEALRRLFAELPPLSELATVPGGQNKTGRNREFVRSWDDVDPDQLRRVEALGDRGCTDGQWVFYSKGGRFAPWWGNWHSVVDWSPRARQFYEENRNSNLLDERFWFREGIVYTDFGGKRFNARWMPPGCVFDMTGPAIFPDPRWWPELTERQRIGAALGILNSSPARRMLVALNPTLHFQVRDVRALPIPELSQREAIRISDDVWELIDGLRDLHQLVDGDPLYRPTLTLEDAACAQRLPDLAELEAHIDAQICQAYGVDHRPLDGADVTRHHALKGLPPSLSGD